MPIRGHAAGQPRPPTDVDAAKTKTSPTGSPQTDRREGRLQPAELVRRPTCRTTSSRCCRASRRRSATCPSCARTSPITSNAIPLSLAVQQYDVLITGLLEIRDSSAQLAGDSTLTYEMRAAAAIASAKEYLSQERVIVLQAILHGTMPPEQRAAASSPPRPVQPRRSTRSTWSRPRPSRTSCDQNVAGPELRPSSTSRGAINRADRRQDARRPARRRLEHRDGPARRADAQGRGRDRRPDRAPTLTTLRDNVQRQIIIDVGLLFGMVLIAMLIAWFVARSMNRSLRELKQGALTVAQYGLPQAVARLRDPTLADAADPAPDRAADRRTAAGAQQGRVRRGDRGVQRGPPRGRPHRRRAGRAAVLGRDDVRQPGPPLADPGRPAHRSPRPAGARRGGPGPPGRAVPARPPGHPDAPQRRKPAGARRRRLHPRPARAGRR